MVPFKVCEAIKGRVPTSSFLYAHFTYKEGRLRNDRCPSHYTQTTDAALIQRLLQIETTLNGLSSEIQKMKEEMMDQGTRYKYSENSCMRIKIKSRQNKFSNLKLNCESKKHSCLLKLMMIKRMCSINTALKDHCKQSKCCMAS